MQRTHGRPLVTPAFHPLADFADFGDAEAEMLRDCTSRRLPYTHAVASAVVDQLSPRLAAAGVGGGVSREAVVTWLAHSSTGPFDADFADFLRRLTHIEGGATFPGVSVPMPAQMIVAAMAVVQGQILLALGNVTDTITLSGLGGIWMDQLMLQLGIMLEPLLHEPSGPRDYKSADDKAALHPYAGLAGFGAAEGRILEETGALLAPLASGVVSLAYSHLLSRPESAGYFQDAHHLAQRKETLMAWWVRTASDPYDADGEFGTYMRRVANAHVKNAGMYPDVGIPAQLTIALMGWVQMRVMTAINTINIVDGGASAIFGLFGDPAVIARVGRAWMSMLTLQLGVLIDPHCFPGALSRESSASSPLP
ncbi:MAG TPA: protoglobin domain-containing protein [Actinomycetota bacterium]|nr:protoglobin domain-containing protein [Actinomycetota bacterium]